MRHCLLLTFLLGVSALARGDSNEVDWEQRLGSQLPLQLRFQDETGQQIELRRYFADVPVVIVFVYFSCRELCPYTLGGIAQTLRDSGLSAGRDYRLLAVSIDPLDTPARASQQERQLSADILARDAAHVLTSAGLSAATLARATGYRYRYDPEHRQFAHPAGFLIARADGRVSRYFFGVRYSPQELRTALLDAREGKIAALLDRLVIICSHFEPLQGRFSNAVMAALRMLIVVTALMIAAMAWRLARRQGR